MAPLDWSYLRAFSATAANGSLSAAARELGLTQPTLSRQVAALEAQLGLTLFERVGRTLALTEAGRALLPAATSMREAADAVALAAAGQVAVSHGRVTISAADMFATHVLPGIVASVRRQAPDVTLAIVATNALSDLRRREADIAIRHVRPTDTALIARKVAVSQAHFYASERWIADNGRPRKLSDLANVDLLAYEPIDRFAAELRSVGIAVTADRFRIVSENAAVLWEMVRGGLGVALMLREVAQRTPGVVRVLTNHPGIPVPIWLVTHRELRTSKRVRIVYDVLVQELSTLVKGTHARSRLGA
jgi:DNA-binding transcriptional LysR family regulator